MPAETPPLQGIDLNLLVSLRALLTARGVSRAAQRLGQSQPTVSRTLQTLRGVFNDDLLVRSGRNMQPTPLGEALLGPVEQVLRQIDLLTSVGGLTDATIRTFQIAAPDLACSRFLPTLAELVSIQAPQLRLVVRGAVVDPVDELSRGSLDMFIGPPIDHAELQRRLISVTDDGWKVLVGPRHAGFELGLDQQAWLDSRHLQYLPHDRPELRSAVDERLIALGLERRIVVQVNNLITIPSLLERTNLVCSLPGQFARELAANQSLRCYDHPLSSELPIARLYLHWHARTQGDAAHKWLRERLVASYQRSPAPPR